MLDTSGYVSLRIDREMDGERILFGNPQTNCYGRIFDRSEAYKILKDQGFEKNDLAEKAVDEWILRVGLDRALFVHVIPVPKTKAILRPLEDFRLICK
jgi:hypothetical protein